MRFSIGIPAFKSAFIKECIDSILIQTYREFELIIINDASPDPIDNIINSYRDNRIQYIKNEKNVGAEKVVMNWNKCLAQANGDYFILMGDDDKLEPTYLEQFDKLIKNYPELDVFHCRSKIIDEYSKVKAITPSWPEYESVFDNIWHRINGFRLQYISDFVYKTRPLKKNGGFYYIPLAWGSDDITAYRQAGNKGIAHTNICLLNYRNSPITISNSGNANLKLLAIQEEMKWFNTFINSSKPSGTDLTVLNQIKYLLPAYFSNKKKNTLISALKDNFFNGVSLSVKGIRNNRILPKEGLSAMLTVLKFKTKNFILFK